MPEDEVISMNRMLGGDTHYSQISRNDGDEAEWQDMLKDSQIIKKQYMLIFRKNIRNKMMIEKLDHLKPGKDIIIKRRLWIIQKH